MPVQRMRERGDRAKALEVAGDPALLHRAREELREGLLGATTRANKNAKLDFAMRLATIAGHVKVSPSPSRSSRTWPLRSGRLSIPAGLLA